LHSRHRLALPPTPSPVRRSPQGPQPRPARAAWATRRTRLTYARHLRVRFSRRCRRPQSPRRPPMTPLCLAVMRARGSHHAQRCLDLGSLCQPRRHCPRCLHPYRLVHLHHRKDRLGFLPHRHRPFHPHTLPLVHPPLFLRLLLRLLRPRCHSNPPRVHPQALPLPARLACRPSRSTSLVSVVFKAILVYVHCMSVPRLCISISA
jgi:hypothetical protein